jgi:hypothetical protein
MRAHVQVTEERSATLNDQKRYPKNLLRLIVSKRSLKTNSCFPLHSKRPSFGRRGYKTYAYISAECLLLRLKGRPSNAWEAVSGAPKIQKGREKYE